MKSIVKETSITNEIVQSGLEELKIKIIEIETGIKILKLEN
jgi:hypothetical protein